MVDYRFALCNWLHKWSCLLLVTAHQRWTKMAGHCWNQVLKTDWHQSVFWEQQMLLRIYTSQLVRSDNVPKNLACLLPHWAIRIERCFHTSVISFAGKYCSMCSMHCTALQPPPIYQKKQLLQWFEILPSLPLCDNVKVHKD